MEILVRKIELSERPNADNSLFSAAVNEKEPANG